jgi:hypothetical protein
MDLTIPYTFYPMALPAPWVWGLFLGAIAVTAVLTWRIARRRSTKQALLLLVPILLGSLVVSSAWGMIITFFTHDI